MKLQREAAEEESKSAFLGYGSEENNFAIKLDYNDGIRNYDIGEGFGHLAIATENVKKMEKRIKSNGGDITRGLGLVKGKCDEVVFAKDDNGYKFELIERSLSPEPLCKIMLHVGDLDRSITFYQKALGMKLLTKRDLPECKCTLAKLGYADEDKTTALELTYKYGIREYRQGDAYSQVVIATDNVHKSSEAIDRMVKILGGKVLQRPGPLPGQKITTFVDPDGWKMVCPIFINKSTSVR
ncbi:hypothetical protein HU200_019281 [Digitaria exilis]|uniref:VOC domain-containing protein n=1 Tax=Digitaria exilis TaxID=1010633 RepID=A0A835F2W4_9POAL|nr:hypothetical protein HU200_019281 [Digitaria exilis]